MLRTFGKNDSKPCRIPSLERIISTRNQDPGSAGMQGPIVDSHKWPTLTREHPSKAEKVGKIAIPTSIQ
jgi:hypothetical protein